VKLKHFDLRRTACGYDEPEGLCLGSVFSISEDSEGGIIFREECDGYHVKEVSKEVAIEILEEALAWVKSGAAL
jgi:hypothetical protein